MKKKINFHTQAEALAAFGEFDKNLKALEAKYNIKIQARGTEASIEGRAEDVEKALQELKNLKVVSEDPQGGIIKTPTGKAIRPLSTHQREYVRAIRQRDLVFAIGPAGTGKTFLACVEAVSALYAKEVERVVLTRPVVEAGEKLGFLPGDMQEKVDPYLRPLYDAFYTLMGPKKFQRYMDDNIIEIVPIAYMRGRTLDDAIIILDEAQNTSSGQMQMFLTRIGFNSKAIVTGDITQVDLEKGETSGLIEIQEILKDVEGVEFVYFNRSDVVRHRLIKKIIDAYNKFKENKKT
ncbi:MAG: PhoH family protein [Elusimicrobiota bacterium]